MATETKIIDITIKYEDALSRIAMLQKSISELTDLSKKLNLSEAENRNTLADYTVTIKQNKQEINLLAKEIINRYNIEKERAKEIDRATVSEIKSQEILRKQRYDSLNELSLKLKQVTKEADDLEYALIGKDDNKKKQRWATKEDLEYLKLLRQEAEQLNSELNKIKSTSAIKTSSPEISKDFELQRMNLYYSELEKTSKKEADINNKKIADKKKFSEWSEKLYQKDMDWYIKDQMAFEKSESKKVGYINELRLSVDRLEQEYYQLTKAELDNVAVGGKMLTELKEKRAELSNLQAAYGKHNLNVGNYSSATKMLGINLGQVMKEMPNFAISARIGIMSLTNNLPMLAESIKAVKLEQIAMKKAFDEGLSSEKPVSMVKLLTKSVFGLTGIMSIAMVLLQIFGEDIWKFTKSLFVAKDAAVDLANAISDINKEANKSLGNKIEEVKKFALDYKKAYEEGDKEKLKNLTEYGKKEYDLNEERLKLIRSTTDGWKKAFDDYLETAKITYYNEAIIKKQTEAQISGQTSLFRAKELFNAKSKGGAVSTGIFGEKKLTWDDLVSRAYNGSLYESTFEALAIYGVAQEIIDELRNINLQNKIIKELPKLKKMPKGAFYNGDDGVVTGGTVGKTRREQIVSDFDYEQKIMEVRVKTIEDGYRQEIGLVKSNYEKKLDAGRDYINRLEQQAKNGNKKAIELLKTEKAKQAEYEIALEEWKDNEILKVNIKYDTIRTTAQVNHLNNNLEMLKVHNEEVYLDEKSNLDKIYELNQHNIEIEIISEELKNIKLKELKEKYLLDIAKLDEKYRDLAYKNKLDILKLELDEAQTIKDVRIRNLEEEYLAKKKLRQAEFDETVGTAQATTAAILKFKKQEKEDEKEYALAKIDAQKAWADTALNVASNVANFVSALGEQELVRYAKTIQGKANYDELYGRKKAEIATRNAILERSIASFSVIVDTAATIMKMTKDLGAAGIPLQIVQGVLGATQLATIWATPLPSYDGGSSSSGSKSTTQVTEKFHTGTYRPSSSSEEKEITRTLLTSERILSPTQTAIFDSMIGKVQSLGGSSNITSGVGVSDYLQESMLVRAFSVALQNQKPQQISWTEFSNQAQRQQQLQNNLIVR